MNPFLPIFPGAILLEYPDGMPLANLLANWAQATSLLLFCLLPGHPATPSPRPSIVRLACSKDFVCTCMG